MSTLKNYTWVFTGASFVITQTGKMSSNRWMDKQIVIYPWGVKVLGIKTADACSIMDESRNDYAE